MTFKVHGCKFWREKIIEKIVKNCGVSINLFYFYLFCFSAHCVYTCKMSLKTVTIFFTVIDLPSAQP
jgi:hypothetical protein